MLATTKGEGVFAYGFRKAGYWLDKTVAQFLIEAIAKTPDKISIVADRADRAPGQDLLQKKPDLQS
jgi:cyclohexanecarboxylate-CoA ligase